MVTRQEGQLIDLVREQTVGPFNLSVHREGGAWSVEITAGLIRVRGVDCTFSAAWDKAGAELAMRVGSGESLRNLPAEYARQRGSSSDGALVAFAKKA